MVNLTIWISLAFYASAVAVSFLVTDDMKQLKIYRILWSLGCAFALIHVFCAFQFVHYWDHQVAVKHTILETERVTGFRFEYGIYFNYLFLLVWTVDCVKLRNARPRKTNPNRKPGEPGEPEESGATHSVWSRFVHVYMLLIIVSATIIFEDGPIRYISLIALALLALLFYFSTRTEAD